MKKASLSRAMPFCFAAEESVGKILSIVLAFEVSLDNLFNTVNKKFAERIK